VAIQVSPFRDEVPNPMLGKAMSTVFVGQMMCSS
jgi:hypothetical protein